MKRLEKQRMQKGAYNRRIMINMIYNDHLIDKERCDNITNDLNSFNHKI